MRLLFITQTKVSLKQDGYYAFPPLAKLMEMLSPLYAEVELCVPVSDEPVSRNTSKLDIDNLKISPLPFYFRRWEVNALRHPFRLYSSLRSHIRDADTVLISVPNYLSVVAWLTCMLARKRFVIRMAGNWAEVTQNMFHKKGMYILGNAAGWIHHMVTKAIVKTASLAISNGQELVNIYGRGHKHVVAVISSTYRKIDIATTIAGGNSEELRILYVGRFDLYKGILELLRACHDMWEEGLKFRLILVGDGPRKEDFNKEAERLGILDKVDFTGWVPIDKLKEIYRSCDIFTLPSYSEGMAKVVPEAMANGLATVVTRVGSLPEIVQEGKTGLIVTPKDVPSLQEALRKLIVDKPLRQSMAWAGLERSQKFTIESEREHVRAALVKHDLLKD